MKKRNINLDLIRAVAIFFVISVHFFLNTPFYSMNLHSRIDILSLFFRFTFYTCVPLFLLLTGYLKNDKEIDKKYYLKLSKIIISYLIVSVICLVFKKYYMNEEYTLIEMITQIFTFSADKYSWYVNMYIGLFLIIPFLNRMINTLNKKEHSALILTLIIISSFPYTFNNFIINSNIINIFPSWWQTIYPITYYVIGKYFKRYPIKLSVKKLTAILIVTLSLQALLIYAYSYGKVFEQLYLNSYSNLFTLIASSAMFLIMLKLKLKSPNKVLESISKVSFEMYLMSFVFDTVVYNSINLKFENSYYYIINYFIYVPIVFTLTYLTSLIVHRISVFIYSIIVKISVKKHKKTTAVCIVLTAALTALILLIGKNSQTYCMRKNSLELKENHIKTEIEKVKIDNRVIIVGDSRMSLISENRFSLNIPINFSFITISGAKIDWLNNQAIKSLDKILGKRNSKIKYHIVLNMGVNDLNDNLTSMYHAVQYKELYSKLIEKYPDVKFYALSVNPIDETIIKAKWPNQKRTNKKIERFNTYIHHSLITAKYCDSYNNIDFKTLDGLHYTKETDKKIINYIVNNCLEYE